MEFLQTLSGTVKRCQTVAKVVACAQLCSYGGNLTLFHVYFCNKFIKNVFKKLYSYICIGSMADCG